MWDRRCRLSIGTKGGKALRGLDLRAFRHGPAAAFFEGAVMTLRVAEGDEKYKRRLFFDGAVMTRRGSRKAMKNTTGRLFFDGARRSAKMEFEPPAAFRADSS